MNRKQRQHLRKHPLDWTPRLRDEALDYIDALEDMLDVRPSTPEPPPTKSKDSQPVTPTIIDHLRKRGTDDADWLADLIEERRQFGIEKYGTELHTHNGRDAIKDARQELGDLVVYLAQAVLEDQYEEAIQFQTRLSRLIPFI